MDVLRLRAALNDAEVEALVQRFYQAVRSDPLLAPVFAERIADAAWPDHLERMVAFWSTILRGTARYQADPMAPHRGLPAGSEHMDRWLELFAATADELFAPEVAAAVRSRAERMGRQLLPVLNPTGL